MALIEYDVYKQKLRELEPELDKLSAALDIESARQEAQRLEDETAQDGFWNDLERSQKVQMRLKQLQNKITRQEKLISSWEDLTTLCEMGQEEDDADILEELKSEFADLEERVEETRMTTLLSGEYDNSNAILQFHAGAGGTSQPATETLAYALRQLGYEVDLDDKMTKKMADYFKTVRDGFLADGTLMPKSMATCCSPI